MFDRLKKWMNPGAAEPEAAEAVCPAGHGAAPTKRTVEVGWLLEADSAQLIWSPPRRLKRNDPPPSHAKSVNYCPAVLDHEARMFEVPCPIDARLGFRKDDKGQPSLVNLDGDQSSIRSKHLNQMLAMVSPREWRHPERPVIQIMTPYIFIADEVAWMTQMPPITHFNPNPWPGILIGGRLPAHLWPRRMMWAFEWWDTSKPLVLKRGDPWFNVRFETFDPTRPVRLVEAERTPELNEHIKAVSSVANYVDKTFTLFKVAEERRPERLLVPKKGKVETED